MNNTARGGPSAAYPVTEPIAVIGLSAIFPGASDLSAYWAEILSGRDALTDIPAAYWSAADYYDPDPKAEDRVYAKRGGFISPVPFDPLKYGIVPHDLPAIDSTQLLALVAADLALADAGYPAGGPADHRRTAVILGVTGALKMVVSLGSRLAHPQLRRALLDSGLGEDVTADVLKRFANEFTPWVENSFPGLLGNVVAGRIAGRLDLGGTNLVVDAACASSLAAVRHALMELRSGQADLVITGGADAFNDPFMFTCFSKTPALSPTGEVRAFDQDGDGTMLGEGVGLLVLKRLGEARRDGDRVYAVIREVGSSSDGRGAAIFAPTVQGQERAIRGAYESIGIDPGTIELVEGHGTGTNVGDAVEVEALTRVFSQSPRASAGRPWCALGSVKSQIGHTKAAAGAAGLIKAALALHYKILPPTAKVSRPLTVLDQAASPFHLSTRPRPWISSGKQPRRAAVSSFAFGGSNFHCLLEEAEPDRPAPPPPLFELMAFSADSPAGLLAALEEAAALNPAQAALAGRRDFRPEAPARLILTAGLLDWPARLGRAGELIRRPEPAAEAEGFFLGQGPPAGPDFGLLWPSTSETRPDLGRETAWPEMLKSLGQAQAALAAEAPELGPLGQALYPPDMAPAGYIQALNDAWADSRLRRAAWRAAAEGAAAVLARFGLNPAVLADLGETFENPGWWVTLGPAPPAAAASNIHFCPFGEGWPGLAALLGRLGAAGFPVDFGAWPAAAAPVDNGGFKVFITGANQFVKKELPPSPRPEVSLSSPGALAGEMARMQEEFLRRQDEILREFNRARPASVISTAPAAPAQAPAPPPPRPEPGGPRDLVLAIVARETGYPLEMLQPSMNLESDLGLDSIKKVEILSALSEARPDLAARPASDLNEAVTLGDLIALCREPGAAAPAAPAEPDLWAELRAVVARETGYPLEMLRPDMRVNEDLGLDSIKMVEILSLMAERLGRADPLPPAAVLDAATLGGLAEALAAGFESARPVALPADRAADMVPGGQAEAGPGPVDLVFEVVARETGYPRDMLKPSMDLESDLGLDSIKKVEIMSSLLEEMTAGGLSVPAPEDLSAARTLGDLAGSLGAPALSRRPPAAPAPPSEPAAIARPEGPPPEDPPPPPPRRGPGRPPKHRINQSSSPALAEPRTTERTTAYQLEAAPLALASYSQAARPEGEVVLVADEGPMAEALAEHYAHRRGPVRRFTWRSAGELARAAPEKLGSLVLVGPDDDEGLAWPREAFRILKAAGQALRRTAAEGRTAQVLGLTFNGGAFGFASAAVGPAGAALAGLLKTAAREWPEVMVRAIDLPKEANLSAAGPYLPGLMAAAMAVGAPAEMGFPAPDRSVALRLKPYRLKNIRVRHLRPGQTLLVTGGARGVTAAALKELARSWSPHLVILGRTPLVKDEPEWLKGLRDEAAVRQAFWDQAGEKPEPRALAAAAARALAEREVRTNLADLENAGAKVTYLSGNFEEEGPLGAALSEIKRLHGPVHGFIHGAGVLADSLILDKKESDFDQVFNTKARLARLILRELEGQPLNLAVFFSSSTARFGRRGQADYAAANEYLNKLGLKMALSRPGPKCLSVNWGPWGGGMVNESLARLFQEEGVGLIPLGEGARLFASLVSAPKQDPVEVVVLGGGTSLEGLDGGRPETSWARG